MKNSRALILSTVGGALLAAAGAFYFASGDVAMNGQSTAVKAKSDFRKAIQAKGAPVPTLAAPAKAAGPKVMPKATAPLVFGLSPKLAQALQTPIPAGVDLKTLPRPKTVLSTTILKAGSLPKLAAMKEGQVIGLPLPDGRSFDGRVNLTKTEAGAGAETLRVGGSLLTGVAGTFSLSQQGEVLRGVVRLPAENRGYVIETRADGQVLMQEHLLADLQCLGMPVDPDQGEQPPSRGIFAAPAAPAVPAFDSLPAAAAVIYIDFDGETVTSTDWNGGDPILASAPLYNGKPLTAQHILQTCQVVAEDYAPFNISVTTSRTRYINAAPGARMRCIVTPTRDWAAAPSSAGLAYLDGFSKAGTDYDEDVPCWCFGIYDPVNMGLVISHEVGHTFGLGHDGAVSPARAYYTGHGTGATSWGPIMGAPYGKAMTQWSSGEYNGADSAEDDVAIIANLTNAIGAVPDEAGGDKDTAAVYTTPNGAVLIKGVISSDGDSDFYVLNVVAAPLTLTCKPSSAFPNLDVVMRLYAPDDDDDDDLPNLIVPSAPNDSLTSTISITIETSGTYYLEVGASGNGDVVTGYSNYGSLGPYTLTGTFATLPANPVFNVQPLPVTLVEGGALTLTSNALTTGGLKYQWFYEGATMAAVAANQKAVLKISGMKPSQSGLYKVQATNASNNTFSTFSNEVQVTVHAKPKITVQPAPKDAVAGTNHTFTVTAEGSSATNELKYTWTRMTKPPFTFPQSTSPGLSLTNITLQDAGNYQVKVTNATGLVVVSKAVALKVASPPVITLHPAPLTTIPTGGSASLKVVVAGTPPFTYKWYKVGTVDPVNTGNSPTFAAKVAGTYHVEVLNATGGSVPTISTDAVVDVEAKPVITSHPSAPAVMPVPGATVTLTVVATGGGTLNYQWQKDGKNISLADNPTANAASLIFDPVAWVNRGAYKVIVSNRVGAVTSKPVTLAVNALPIIITHPANPTRGPTGGTAVFTVVAGGNAPLKYQWYFNSMANAVPKGTAAKLSLTKLTTAANGQYFCRVTDKDGNNGVNSDSAELIVEDLPKVTSITSDKAPSHKVGVDGSITLSITHTGAITGYQWMKAGKPLAGKTDATLTLSPAQVTDSASYSVVVTNNVGTAKSAALKVSVLLPPTIQVPVSVTVLESFSATLSVKAAGSPTLKYQWQKIVTPGTPAAPPSPEVPPVVTNLDGKTSANLTFSKAKMTDAGSYRCIVSNDVGTAVSLDAVITVTQIEPAVITRFLPRTGKAGSLVRVIGSDFTYVTSATFGTAKASITKVSDTELFLTVPVGTTAPVQITLTNRALNTTTSASSYTRTLADSNDFFADAMILTGTSISYTSTNTGFTTSGDGFNGNSVGNAWYYWKVPKTGTYRWYVNANFDSQIVLYRNTPFASFFYGTTVDYGSYIDQWWELVEASFVKGEDVMIQIAGSLTGVGPAQGTYSFSCTPLYLAMPTPNSVELAQPMAAELQTHATTGETPETSLGGDTATQEGEVVLTGLTAADASASPLVVTAFNMRLETPPEKATSMDTFGWTIYDVNGLPLAALVIDAADGALYESAIDGSNRSLNQTLVAGSNHKFEITVNQLTSTWSVTMDGVEVISDASLPGSDRFGEVCPVWWPSQDGSPHATLIFSGLRILKSPEVSSGEVDGSAE